MASDATGDVLATIRLHWQAGNWPQINAGTGGGAALKGTPAAREIDLYRLQALLMAGDVGRGREMAKQLLERGVSAHDMAAALISGAHGSLVRGWLCLGDAGAARRHVLESVASHPAAPEPKIAAALRLRGELRAVETALGQMPLDNMPRRKLFIDGGGHDGCSALMFLLQNPEFDCVTFEPNQIFWHHYGGLPVTLIGKALYTYDGNVAFRIDPVDGDGSSLIEGKRIDATRQVPDAECPVENVPCVDLSRYVREASEKYSHIVLKLDVEGAEYEIFEKMMADGTLALVNKVYCEFHQKKMPISKERHTDILSRVQEVAGHVEAWDAHPFKTGESASEIERRKILGVVLSNLRTQSIRAEYENAFSPE